MVECLTCSAYGEVAEVSYNYFGEDPDRAGFFPVGFSCSSHVSFLVTLLAAGKSAARGYVSAL